MKKSFVWLILCVMVSLHVAGCQKGTDEQGENVYRLDPNTVGALEKSAGAGITLLQVLSALVPAILPVSTAGAAVLATWLKIRPAFNEYKSTNVILHDGACVFVEMVEQLKKENPEEAAKVLAKMEALKDKIINPEDRKKLEAVIRGLRGLPPKV